VTDWPDATTFAHVWANAVMTRADSPFLTFVVPSDIQSPPSVADLMEWCQGRLGRAKQPRDITQLDELPCTSVGKIRKFVLKEEVSRA
jgi:acyl-CoA synthetase (AMP-forming)/AMP-acid ligase II